MDLSALAREVARSLDDASLARPVQWRVEDGLQVHGDPRLLRAALANLLGNAWKYTAQQPRPE